MCNGHSVDKHNRFVVKTALDAATRRCWRDKSWLPTCAHGPVPKSSFRVVNFFFVFPAFGLRPACRGASTNKQNTSPISSYNFARGRISSAKRNSRKKIPRFRNCSQHHCMGPAMWTVPIQGPNKTNVGWEHTIAARQLQRPARSCVALIFSPLPLLLIRQSSDVVDTTWSPTECNASEEKNVPGFCGRIGHVQICSNDDVGTLACGKWKDICHARRWADFLEWRRPSSKCLDLQSATLGNIASWYLHLVRSGQACTPRAGPF